MRDLGNVCAGRGRAAEMSPAAANTRSARMSEIIEKMSFPYSRIYAQGWNVARRSSLKGAGELKKLAASNPYKTDHERARWAEGFSRGAE